MLNVCTSTSTCSAHNPFGTILDTIDLKYVIIELLLLLQVLYCTCTVLTSNYKSRLRTNCITISKFRRTPRQLLIATNEIASMKLLRHWLNGQHLCHSSTSTFNSNVPHDALFIFQPEEGTLKKECCCLLYVQEVLDNWKGNSKLLYCVFYLRKVTIFYIRTKLVNSGESKSSLRNRLNDFEITSW